MCHRVKKGYILSLTGNENGGRQGWEYARDLSNYSLLRRMYSRRTLLQSMARFWPAHLHLKPPHLGLQRLINERCQLLFLHGSPPVGLGSAIPVPPPGRTTTRGFASDAGAPGPDPP